MAVALMDWQPVLGQPQQHPPTMEHELESSSPDYDSKSLQNLNTPILQLPPELLSQIFSYLSAPELAWVSATCRSLAEHANDELLWANLINSYLPEPIHDPGIFDSFRSLYVAHHPYWFIAHKKLWFSDMEHMGMFILCRYDHRRGVIEGYRVIATRRSSDKFQVWEWNPDVIIQAFDPKVKLWLDDAVLFLKGRQTGQWRYLDGEARMPIPSATNSNLHGLSLCCHSTPPDITEDTQWPPPSIPSDHRAYGNRKLQWSEWNCPPRRFEDMSESIFRIRSSSHFVLGMQVFPAETATYSERISTFATLHSNLYTPTVEKPYQGIWVGDYSAHGCEILLFMQQDNEDGNPHPLETTNEGIIQKGSLRAIKLTGDPNVPRGQTSWVSNDIGPAGTIRIAEEDLFRGARVVRSIGHVAGLGFSNDTFIPSQLILISTDLVAHYWQPMGHITYYRRLDIDALLRT